MLVVLSMSLLVAGCVTAGSISASPATPAASPSDEHACFGTGVQRDGGPELVADFVGQGMTFVSGTVVGVGPAFFNTADGTKPRDMGAAHPTSGQPYPMIYTPIDVTIDRTVTGSLKPGANRLLIEGGKIGCISMEVNTAPTVVKGGRYVFVLTPALDADRKQLGNQFVAYTVFPIDSSGIASTRDGRMSIDALATKVAASSKATP